MRLCEGMLVRGWERGSRLHVVLFKISQTTTDTRSISEQLQDSVTTRRQGHRKGRHCINEQ